jgi:hypothetical protein
MVPLAWLETTHISTPLQMAELLIGLGAFVCLMNKGMAN